MCSIQVVLIICYNYYYCHYLFALVHDNTTRYDLRDCYFCDSCRLSQLNAVRHIRERLAWIQGVVKEVVEEAAAEPGEGR